MVRGVAGRRRRPPASGRRGPPEPGAPPGPVVPRGVEPFARAHDEVLRFLFAERLEALGPGLVARLRRTLPGRVGVHRLLGRAVALRDEAGPVGDLRRGGLRPEVPHGGGEEVRTRPQEGSEIEGLETPEQDVAAGRADTHPTAVHVQDEALVGAHVDHEAGRNDRQIDRLPEAEDAGVALGRARARDPGAGPLAPQDGVGDREPAARRCGGKRGGEGENAASRASSECA